ncbi:metal ABC transporter ATP-binding protein [Coprobacter sp.]
MLLTEEKRIEISGVSLQYDCMPVLENIDLTVYNRDFLAITGPNGGGKTTLLRIILGLLPPSSGKVLFYRDGLEVPYLNMGYLPQKNAIDSRFPLTVSEVIFSGLMGEKRFLKPFTSEQQERVEEALTLVGLEKLRERPIGKLSGGQMQRVLLARALVSRPEILLLDEPSSYVDQEFEGRMYELFCEINEKTTIILVSHELSRVEKVANRIIHINRSMREVIL